MTKIDLNSDMGERDTLEGLALDAKLMPFITSVNIACGGHAGSPDLMRHTAKLAAQHGVAIGAHPSFLDRKEFGRVLRSFTPAEIRSMVEEQIKNLAAVLEQDGFNLNHVKPHGALYNAAATDPLVAEAIVQAIQHLDRSLRIYALANSALSRIAQSAGLTVVQEAFVDRAYRADGTLVPRTQAGALLSSENSVVRQIRQLISGSVTSIDGTTFSIQADSFCLHSDTPHAIDLAQLMWKELAAAGIQIVSARSHHA